MLTPNHITHHFAELGNDFSTPVSPRGLLNPKLVCVDPFICRALDLDEAVLSSPEALAHLSGNRKIARQPPVAMVYAGHQFGGYSPRLGDGRGVLIGETKTSLGLMDIHLKGAGKTPYSRFGDGYAVLRSCIREYLASIAMRGLGIPTSHALCVIQGDNEVTRETLEPAATLTRLARTHIRFGSFEYFFHTRQVNALKMLADYTIKTYLPTLQNDQAPYDCLFNHAVTQTAKTIAHWQAVGFCHGVMNTDNMSILGDTIDYGPYGFMEAFDPGHICNSSDHQGRYAFDRQPSIGLWNLRALALALSPLTDTQKTLASLERYEDVLNEQYSQLLLAKYGLKDFKTGDETLIQEGLSLLGKYAIDYTSFFTALTELCGQLPVIAEDTVRAAGESILGTIRGTQSATDKNDKAREEVVGWLLNYVHRLKDDAMTLHARKKLMDNANPKYILRNYYAQQAIENAYTLQDYTSVQKLAEALATPYTFSDNWAEYTKMPPASATNLSVSCSS